MHRDDPIFVRKLHLFLKLAHARRPLDRRELAYSMGVSPRTVGRYILDLQCSGLPIEDRIEGKRQVAWFDRTAARPDWLTFG